MLDVIYLTVSVIMIDDDVEMMMQFSQMNQSDSAQRSVMWLVILVSRYFKV